MKTCRGTQEQLEQLLSTLNKKYGYPNLTTQTLTYSSIQTEYETNQPCMVIFDEDASEANLITGIVVEDGITIKQEPIEEPINTETTTPETVE